LRSHIVITHHLSVATSVTFIYAIVTSLTWQVAWHTCGHISLTHHLLSRPLYCGLLRVNCGQLTSFWLSPFHYVQTCLLLFIAGAHHLQFSWHSTFLIWPDIHVCCWCTTLTHCCHLSPLYYDHFCHMQHVWGWTMHILSWCHHFTIVWR